MTSLSIQRRLQIYFVLIVMVVALVSGAISGIIYYRASLSTFYNQTRSTLTYFENAILRQKMLDNEETASNLASLNSMNTFLEHGFNSYALSSLKNASDSGNDLVAITNKDFAIIYLEDNNSLINLGHLSVFLQSRNKINDRADKSFYYGDLQGQFYAVSQEPIYQGDHLVGYILIGSDLTNPAYTDHIGEYFGFISTIFYRDIRVNTNLSNPDEDYLGTALDSEITTIIYDQGRPFSGIFRFRDTLYVGTYEAIEDEYGIAGAVFIGQEYATLLESHKTSIYLIAFASIVIAFIVMLITRRVITQNINQPIRQTIDLLGKMALDPAILADEDIALTKDRSMNKLLLNLKSTAVKIAEDRDHLSYLAFHDRLTGLYNSKRLFDYYTKATANINDQSNQDSVQLPALLLTINIDFFKRHKKYLGQQAAEELLIMSAQRLQDSSRKYNCDLYRMNADEFIACSEVVYSDESLTQLLDELSDDMQKPFDIAGKTLNLTVSIGAVRRSDTDFTINQLLEKANMALDTAKFGGRNRYDFYDPNTADTRKRYLLIEQKLRTLQDYSQFELYYQPQVNSENNEIFGLEALIRWNDPELGQIAPSEFIPLAEAIGLIVPIGNWVLNEALRFKSKLNKHNFNNLHISINIAAAQITEPDFVFRIMDLVKTFNISPFQIVLEITETQLVQSLERATANLNKLREKGFNIAMDDFGTGYSSLSYISNLPVSILKIDRSFISALDSELNLELVKEMINIGHKLDMTVISEGVETKKQLSTLSELTCNCIQGFFISRPISSHQIINWLKNYRDQLQ